jgi:anti-sigma factor RsiW
MTGGRRFSPPDWGQDHLSLDAIVAYVDDELSAGAHARAEAHLDRCRECAVEVVAQRQARTALRAAGGPCLPSSLLRSLRSIPVEAELPPPPPGLAVTADGQFVLLRDVPRADGPDAYSCDLPPGAQPDAAPRRFSRRARVGVISGLALGALAVGTLAAPMQATPVTPGVLDTAVLSVPAAARLSAAPAVVPAVIPVAIPAARPAESPTASATPAAPGPGARTTDEADVLDAGLRARLDNAPIAFHRAP